MEVTGLAKRWFMAVSRLPLARSVYPFLLRETRVCLLYARDEYAEGFVSPAGRNEVHA
jgi:hypothetical protein